MGDRAISSQWEILIHLSRLPFYSVVDMKRIYYVYMYRIGQRA